MNDESHLGHTRQYPGSNTACSQHWGVALALPWWLHTSRPTMHLVVWCMLSAMECSIGGMLPMLTANFWTHNAPGSMFSAQRVALVGPCGLQTSGPTMPLVEWQPPQVLTGKYFLCLHTRNIIAFRPGYSWRHAPCIHDGTSFHTWWL